jgi:hypothetical protein
MKIEIDLEKVRYDLSIRKEKMKETGAIEVQVRQWGEVMEAHAAVPDEILIETMRKTIEGRIQEFIEFAPDVSDLKPSDIRVEAGMSGKRVLGSFFYCSQIADHWYKKQTDAVKNERRSARIDTLIDLEEMWLEQSENGTKRCWQRTAARQVQAMLRHELGLDEDE